MSELSEHDDAASHREVEAAAAQGASERGQVTKLLGQLAAGDRAATDELLPLVYDQLRNVAQRLFRAGRGSQTLQPTAVVHDVFLKLVDKAADWNDRQHFYAVASRAMRQLLTDVARARASQKRGGEWGRVSLSWVPESSPASDLDVVDVDAAISELKALNERHARIVELRFLTGLSIQETADILGISRTTVHDEWRLARAFLRRNLSERAG